MELPILNQLEKIYPNQDTGAAAIRKLVKNQNLIEQGIKEAELIPGPQGPPGIQGQQGNSPYIGSNGNWWIDNIDTGVSANAAINIEELQKQINDLLTYFESKTNILQNDIKNGFTLQSGQQSAYTKIGSLLVLNLAVTNTSSVSSWVEIITLPEGYRISDAGGLRYANDASGNNVQFNLQKDGKLMVKSVVANTITCLNTIFILG